MRPTGATVLGVIFTGAVCAACAPVEPPSAASPAAPPPSALFAAPALPAAEMPPPVPPPPPAPAPPPDPPTATATRCLRPLATVAPPIPPKAATCPRDTATHLPPLGHGRVRVDGAAGTTVKVEIARTSEATERGLMFRTAMAEDAGMYFDLRERTEHTFWMHNTCIPLDLLFVDTDGTIVGVEEAAPTLDDGPRTVGCFSDHVLEVNAGWTRRHGVTPGQKLVLVTGPASK